MPGVRAYVYREPLGDIYPGALLPVHKAVEAYLALPGGARPAPAPEAAPRATYLPQHQPQALTTFAIVERSSDQALARVHPYYQSFEAEQHAAAWTDTARGLVAS